MTDLAALAPIISGGGAVALCVVVWLELKAARAERREDHRETTELLAKMVERLTRIDIRTAEGEAVPQPTERERSRRQRTRTPAPTPFTDTPPRGNR